jgi:membrane-associated phospholipid phosphatase
MPIRARWALGFAGACAATVGLLWLAAFHVGFVERADHRVLFAFYNFTFLYERHGGAARFVVSLCEPPRVVFLAPVPIVVALARRRTHDACAAFVLLVGAGVTTLVLKHVLPEPFVGVPSPVPYPRFPSGHSTVAMSLVLALTLVVPARLRPLIAGLGAVFAAAVGYALLTLGSHYPTDVFGGFLVATTWALLTAAALFAFDGRLGRSARSNRRLSFQDVVTPPIAALIAAAVLATIVVLNDPHAVVSYVRDNTAFIVGVVAIAALSTAVATGVVLSVRR